MRRIGFGLIAAAVLAATPLQGQQSTTIGAFELRPSVGAFIPTGALRDNFRDAMLVGIQGGFEFNSNVHMLLGGYFSRNDAHGAVLGADKADIWQFDAGAELNGIASMGRDWFFRPFVGAGAGIRTYDYPGAMGTNRCAAGYGSVGTEFQRFAGAFRFETRDYVSCFESPLTGVKKTRNDLGFMFGFVYHVM